MFLWNKKQSDEILSLTNCFIRFFLNLMTLTLGRYVLRKIKNMRDLKKKNLVDSNLFEYLKKKDLFLTEYNKMIEEGLDDVRCDRLISKDDLEKEMLDWDND